jgi:hypothetical protein
VAKNTGRGTRAKPETTQIRDEGASATLWRRNAVSGLFTESKKTGGAFKGLRRTG